MITVYANLMITGVNPIDNVIIVAVKHVLRFLEDQSYVGGSFWRYIDQYKEKNCNSKSPILSVSLLYHIQSVQTDRYSVALANGTFSFAESNPSYCSNMKALENYTLEYVHLICIQ